MVSRELRFSLPSRKNGSDCLSNGHAPPASSGNKGCFAEIAFGEAAEAWLTESSVKVLHIDTPSKPGVPQCRLGERVTMATQREGSALNYGRDFSVPHTEIPTPGEFWCSRPHAHTMPS